MSATQKKAPCARLLDQGSIFNPRVPFWAQEAYSKFREQVLHPKYPCYWATMAEKRGDLRYTWIDNPDDPSLPATLRDFCRLMARLIE